MLDNQTKLNLLSLPKKVILKVMKKFGLIIFIFLCNICFAQEFIELQVIGDLPLKNPKSFDRDKSGFFYITDSGNNRIVKVDSLGKIILTKGKYGWENGKFDLPIDIDASSGLDIFVADFNNRRVQRFDRSLNFLSVFPNEENNLNFGYVSSSTFSSQSDLIFLDSENGVLQKVGSDGKFDETFEFAIGSSEIQMQEPIRVRINKSKKIVVLDKKSLKLFIFDYFGNFLTDFGDKFLQKPITFRIYNGEILVLDSDLIYSFNFSGGVNYLIKIPQKEEIKGITDFLIFDGKIAFLKMDKILFWENFKKK